MHARRVVAVLLFPVVGAVSHAAPRSPENPESLWPRGFTTSLQNVADPAPLLRALDTRWDSRAGRRLRRIAPAKVAVAAQTCGRNERFLADDPIAAAAGVTEYAASLAASPRRQNILVSAHVASSPNEPRTWCEVRRSLDRGRTWSAPVPLPTLTPTSACDVPVLAYSHDGRTLYAAFRDFKAGFEVLPPPPGGGTRRRIFQDDDVVVSRSEDDGRTWSLPVFAIEGDGWSFVRQCAPACEVVEIDPGENLDRPQLATGGGEGADGWAYATATRVAFLQPEGTPPTSILFARSRDWGRTWDPRVALADGAAAAAPGLPGPTAEVVVQGSRAAAAGNGVLVAWYHSGTDGPRTGAFEIRTRWSGDNGASWDEVVVAAFGELELGATLGPVTALRGRSWWAAMFPAVALDGRGGAHVAYTHDPDPAAGSPEEGDIRHVASPLRPYRAWSSPVTVNDDGPGRAQGFPSLATRRLGRTALVEIAWEDSRLADGDNARYDVFHAQLILDRRPWWSSNRRVSDVSSLQSVNATGERTALAANDSGVVYAVWTDRRDSASLTDVESDVYGSRVGIR
jgi:hypothetical protein